MKSSVNSVPAGIGKSDVNMSMGSACRGTLWGGFDHGGQEFGSSIACECLCFCDA